jgi:hypothetical protein
VLFFILLPCLCPGVCSCSSAFVPACCSVLCYFLTIPVLLMSSRGLLSETMVLFGVLVVVFPVGFVRWLVCLCFIACFVACGLC